MGGEMMWLYEDEEGGFDFDSVVFEVFWICPASVQLPLFKSALPHTSFLADTYQSISNLILSDLVSRRAET
jgi:hypothetical protein